MGHVAPAGFQQMTAVQRLDPAFFIVIAGAGGQQLFRSSFDEGAVPAVPQLQSGKFPCAVEGDVAAGLRVGGFSGEGEDEFQQRPIGGVAPQRPLVGYHAFVVPGAGELDQLP